MNGLTLPQMDWVEYSLGPQDFPRTQSLPSGHLSSLGKSLGRQGCTFNVQPKTSLLSAVYVQIQDSVVRTLLTALDSSDSSDSSAAATGRASQLARIITLSLFPPSSLAAYQTRCAPIKPCQRLFVDQHPG